MWEMIATFLSGVALALLARVPALTVEGRMVGRLERDTKLLPQIPEGPARDTWAAMVSDQSSAVVEHRREASARSIGRRRTALWMAAVAAVGGMTVFAWLIGPSGASPAAVFAGAASAIATTAIAVQSLLNDRATRATRVALLRLDHRREVLDPIVDALIAEVHDLRGEVHRLAAIPELERTESQERRAAIILTRIRQISRFKDLLLVTFPEVEVREEAPVA